MLTKGLGLTEPGSEVSESVTGMSGEQQQLHREFCGCLLDMRRLKENKRSL
jgi:hypothetical protein